MARVSGSLVMTGSKDGEYSMAVEFSDNPIPHQLRKGGYYVGHKTLAAMIEEFREVSGLQSTGASTGEEGGKPGITVGNIATASTDELRTVESQSSTESPKQAAPGFNSPPTAMDSAEEVPERSQSAAGFQLQVGPFKEKPVRSVGRAPGSLRRDSGGDEDEFEVTEVDEYNIFVGDQSNPVSLGVLPLKLEDQELIGDSVSTTEVSLCGKSGGLEIMRPITAWKLVFPEKGSFHILVKITPTSAANRWVKLGKPRSGYKEIAEDVFCVAKFLAILKEEPRASEDRVRNHILEGDVISATFCDHLRKQFSLLAQYINSDPALREADAQKILLSVTREKVANAGKRTLLLDENSSDEDDSPRAKKPKTDHARPEDMSMREYESEDEYYDDEEREDEDDESDDEPGDSLCTICDDGGELLCCDGPCMRSFHARKKDGIDSKCQTLGFPDDSEIGMTTSKWLCRNCKRNKHQCYICGELGDSDKALGVKRHVFVCDVASCGKFYHPSCVASKLKATPDEREAMAKDIQAGEETFTCPLHRCKECGKGEEKKVEDLNLATCRRCPAAWHKKCLPRNVSFLKNEESNYEVRAWKLDNRFIIYCTDHKIVKYLGTPERDHLKLLRPEPTKISKKPLKKVSNAWNEPSGFRAKASDSAVTTGRSAGTARAERQHTYEDAANAADAAKRLVEDIVAKTAQKVTEESVKSKLSLPKFYQVKKINFLSAGRTESILNGAKAAVEKFQREKNWEDAKLKCPQSELAAIINEEEHLKTFLAPTLYGKRYTSYGRHFTKREKLDKVVEMLQPYIWDRDTIVDFSCGDNSFSRMLHDALSNSGKTNCQYKNFDLFAPNDTFGFERKDWFTVGINDCGLGDNLVIGLNPPFALAENFVNHALTMQPRVIVLIVPPLKRKLDHRGYICLLDDDTTMAEKSFYLPGSVHSTKQESLEQGNNIAPHFYIYCAERFANRYGVLKEPLTATPSQQIQRIRKTVKPARPSPQADPTVNIYSQSGTSQQRLHGRVRDPRSVSVQPQHVPNRISRPPGPESWIEEGEITGSRSHASFIGSSSYMPLPPPSSGPAHSSRPSQFHDNRYGHSSQSPPPFHPRHISEIAPPYYPPEYSPFEPALYPLCHVPRGLPRPYRPPLPHHPHSPPFNFGPPRPQNQQFYPPPSALRGPYYPPGPNFEGDHDGESGGWLS